MQVIEKWMSMNEVLTFYLLLACSFFINRIPYIGSFFRTVNTMLHESGHALGAIVTNGEVVRIELKKDTSGIAETKSKRKWCAFLISFAGYPFAAIASASLLALSVMGYQKIAAFILLSIAMLNLMLFVRNVYGVVWLILFSSLLLVLTNYATDQALKTALIFICLIALTEAFTSTIIVTMLGLSKPAKAGDLRNLYKSSGIPAGFWAIMNFGLVMVILFYTVSHYFPNIQSLLSYWA